MMKRILLCLLMMTAVSVGVRAQTGVQNYVSASGYVIFNAPFYYTGADGYAFDFENDYVEGRLLDWTYLDADGDGYNWTLSPVGEGYGHHGSDGVLMSYSYSNYSGPLTPDNYLVSPPLSITANNHFVTFYACALDEAYPADHFGLAVSNTTGDAPDAFTLLDEWTMTAKQGGWHEYSVDLNNYIGQEVYIAIRHFNCTDKFCLCVDDVFVGPQTKDPLVGCRLVLDGSVQEASLTGTSYLLDTDGFVDGSSHNVTITATYQSGATLMASTDWTFRSSDHFVGSPIGLNASSDGSTVTLDWELPMMESSYGVDELFYDFADSTMSDLTLIDGNHDGHNFRVYPYGGYGSGMCLRSDSWMAGGLDNLNPDNFLVLPLLTPKENAVFSFMAVDSDMPGIAPDPEHFGVAVSTTGNTDPADFTMLQEWNSTGQYTLYSVDLSAYAGQPIYVAIRHFNTTGDCYFLYVDNIKVTHIEASVMRPAKGAMVYANGALVARLNHGETQFVHAVNRYDSEYCIRVIQEGSKEDGTCYALAEPQCARVELDCVAPKNLSSATEEGYAVLTWEREIYTGFEEDPQGWAFLDADGDGYVFGIYNAGGMDPDGSVNTTNNPALCSWSFINGLGGLTPDNYAFMPKMKILDGAILRFYASALDPSYPSEHFGVAVADGEGEHITTIAEWDASYPYAEYKVDLSQYAGQELYLGFRHFTQVSNYALGIDNITVVNAVWSGTASVTDHYNIYRADDGQNYQLVDAVDGNSTSYRIPDKSVLYYYKVTAVNTIVGGDTCESAPALSVDGMHDYVTVVTDAVSEQSDGISVYPNPTAGIITVEAIGMTRLTVMNALGQVVYDAPVDADEVSLDLAQFGAGMYVVRINTATETLVKRISVVK